MAFDLNLSQDQRLIVEAAAALLAESFPLGRLREARQDDLAPLCAFGAFSLSASEEEGGSGFTIVEEALVHTLLGRHLLTTRSLATTVAAAVARSVGEGALATAIASLGRPVCAGLPGAQGILVLDPVPNAAVLVFGDRQLSLVETGAVREQPGLGHSVAVALAGGTGSTLASTDDPARLAAADLLVSCHLLGVAEGARDLAVAYAAMRRQFGKPIGAFQAVKHHAADMAIRAEMLSAQRDMAAIALADRRPDAAFQVAALRRLAPPVALANARACIQLHGGIGFSAEADAHHFVKHAHALSRLGEAASLLDLPSPMAPRQPAAERT
ncbi:acyl-CoA dehydrogenase family protein [uncultured Alsobacter sp.]|uniref:acyl-CoA dehydrogenase family protein n=1 Tax=uncultured Alsobacter sp. TaxID=1748258 RepID=UPI0025EF556A|nr:acyl-CoA dehydrogenase family protein [uncultured Alsobacter sp.]